MNYKRSIILLFSLVSFSSHSTYGEDTVFVSVSGFVRSDIDFMPINYGIVHIKEIGMVIFINNAGWYKLERVPKGRHTISAKVDGYFTKDTTITVDSSTNINLDFVLRSKCSINATYAKKDIQIGKPTLLFIGGILSPDHNSQDRQFESQYGVKLVGLGCTAPPMFCIIDYNMVIFKYLDGKFGKQWRKEVRSDILGLENK